MCPGPPDPPRDRVSADALPAAISNAMARIKREFYGKGPARTRTYVCDRFVFSVLDDVLTPVELALKEGGRASLVRDLRLTFEAIMTAAFTGEVENLTGGRVVGYHSQVVFDPDMAIEIFVLDEPVGDTATATREVTSARPAEPGDAGDVDSLPGPSSDGPMVEPEPPRGWGDGRLRAAIANAMSRVTREHWGKGPERAKAYLEDNFVFCVLEDPLTTVERTLVDAGEQALVRRVRMEFQELRQDAFARQVERVTGREVLACHNQVVFDPDMVFQIFVLRPGGGAAGQADADVRSATR